MLKIFTHSIRLYNAHKDISDSEQWRLDFSQRTKHLLLFSRYARQESNSQRTVQQWRISQRTVHLLSFSQSMSVCAPIDIRNTFEKKRSQIDIRIRWKLFFSHFNCLPRRIKNGKEAKGNFKIEIEETIRRQRNSWMPNQFDTHESNK